MFYKKKNSCLIEMNNNQLLKSDRENSILDIQYATNLFELKIVRSQRPRMS